MIPLSRIRAPQGIGAFRIIPATCRRLTVSRSLPAASKHGEPAAIQGEKERPGTANANLAPKPPGPLGAEDVERKAKPLDRSLPAKMTPTMKSFTLDGKVAVVSGGAQGLGWNMSQALAEAGAKAIVLFDLKQDVGDKAAAELQDTTGVPVRFYVLDVTDSDATAEAIGKVSKEFDSVDIVINAAGVVDTNIKAETYELTPFRRLIDINLTGSFLLAQACGRQMMQQKSGGSIIFLSSIAGSRVLHPQQQCAYNASKAAVTQLANSLAAEWAPHGIRVNTIAPGYMDTQLNQDASLGKLKEHWVAMTPMRRLGRPDELNGMAVFLASDAAGFVTGAHIYADGGYAVY
ncbi:MAG: hypothetical protein Q9163_000792 [Psora crenata]